VNVKLSSLILYPCEPNNIKNGDKVDSLLEILAKLVESWTRLKSMFLQQILRR